jgi:hypothetical protein
VVNVSWRIELYVVELIMPREKRYDKSLSLEEIREYLRVKPYGKSYEDYVKPGLLYFTEDLNALARELSVNEIVPMGLFIRGIYGGEEKKGEEKYAGLILVGHRLDRGVFEFRLYNTSSTLVVPVSYLDKYGIRVYKMIYVGEVNPFKIARFLEIILSQRGSKALKEFLEEALKLNERSISKDDHEKIKMLVSELQQPGTISTLDTGKYYVVYRRVRAFTASVFKPTDESFIVKDEVGYIKCNSEPVAYYYAAVLNYLAFKVVETRRLFNRTQYARPVLAMYIAGLSWNNVNDEVRGRVVELSKELHRKAPNREYPNQRVALKDIARLPEFRELVGILDSRVNRENLEKALNIVSGHSRRKRRGIAL